MRIWQITPRFFPSVCGVGDYTRILGSQLQDDWGIESIYAVADARHSAAPAKDPTNLTVIGSRSAADWHAALNKPPLPVDAVVVQASFYGYDPRGAPLWLARLLREIRNVNGPPVLTMFHELYASGPVGSLAFWQGFYQRWIVRLVASRSTAIRTNRKASQCWLEKHSGHPASSIPTQPVFSNLGEAMLPLPSFSSRQRVIIAPGAHPRSTHWSTLLEVAQTLGCTRICLTGPASQKGSETRDGMTIDSLGVLEAASFSHLMVASQFGFLDYNPDFLGKSGHLAAFAAHGVVPILPQGRGDLPDGISESRHFLSPQALHAVDNYQFEDISSALLQWYKPHGVQATAASYADQLNRMLGRAASHARLHSVAVGAPEDSSAL